MLSKTIMSKIIPINIVIIGNSLNNYINMNTYSKILMKPLPEFRTIHETKIKQVPLKSLSSFEEPKLKVRKVKKIKRTVSTISLCPYCGKNLPSPTTIAEWRFCLYCGMKL